MSDGSELLSHPLDLLITKLMESNFLTDIADMKRMMQQRDLHTTLSATAADLTKDGNLGLMTAGEFRTTKEGSAAEPGEGFSGTRMSSEPQVYGNKAYHLAGYKNDVRQWGANSDTGALTTAGDQIQFDEEAQRIFQGTHIIHTYDDDHVVVTNLQQDGGSDLFGLIQRSYEVPASTNSVDNPGFESGSFTDWTASSHASHTWSVSTARLYDPDTSAFSAKLVLTSDPGAGGATLTSDQTAIGGDATSELSLVVWCEDLVPVVAAEAVVVYVKWYDGAGAGSLIGTDVAYIVQADRSWQPTIEIFQPPAGAAGAVVQIKIRGSSGTVYLDNVSLKTAGDLQGSRTVHHAMGFQIDDGGLLLGAMDDWHTLPSDYIGLWNNDGTLRHRSGSTDLLLLTAGIADAKGDLIAGTADNTVARLAVGSNTAKLYADSNASTGLRWSAPSGGRAAIASNTKTTLYTTSIAQSGLGTNGFIDVDVPFIYRNTTGGNTTITFTVEFGATTLFAVATANIGTASNSRTGKLHVRLSCNNSASAQDCYIDFDISGTAAAGSTSGKASGDTKAGFNVATEATASGAKTLTISATLSSTDATNHTFRTLGELVDGPHVL